MVFLSWIPQASEGNGQIIQIIKPNSVCIKTELSNVKERKAIYESLALQVREKIPEKVIPEVFSKGKFLADGTAWHWHCGRRRHVVVRELMKTSTAGAQSREEKIEWDETEVGRGTVEIERGGQILEMFKR